MIYGYMRVSTQEQKFESQKNLLDKRCDIIVCEKQSGVKKRHELDNLLNSLKKDDTLVVTRLDRLGRSLKELVNIIDLVKKKEAHFISLIDKIDTSTPLGKFFFHLNAAYAEFERNIIVNRTIEGLEAARKAGRVGGRKPGLTPEGERKALIAAQLYKQYKVNALYSINELASMVGVSKSTFYRYIKHEGVII